MSLPLSTRIFRAELSQVLRRVIHSLAVVRVRSSLEQQASQLCVVSDSGRTVEGALELRRLMVVRIEAGVRARSGVEQRLRRPHEAVRPCAVEPEISRETEVGQRIPTAGASLRRGVPRIKREEPAHGRIVAENRRRMDVAARDLGVLRQDRLGALECAGSVPAVEWNTCGLDEGR